MCDIETANLIDFGDALQKQESHEQTTEFESSQSSPSTTDSGCCLISAPALQGRESLDNNPFDHAQNLANRPDDPFDIVEKEACFKARESQSRTAAEVKLANLLSLSDDNLLDDDSESAPQIPKFGSDSTMASMASSIQHSNLSNVLDIESPPLQVSTKWTPESDSSARESGTGSASSTDGGSNSSKQRKGMEYRKRLLKLSISNSTFNSPVSRHIQTQNENGTSVAGYNSSAMSSIFFEALHSDHMLSAESPLKLVDDDLLAEEPPSLIETMSKDFDADLEMLKIPMLKELPSPVITEGHFFPPREERLESKTREPSADLSDLNELREKLRLKRVESNNGQDIPILIENLKSLICDNKIVDDQRKQQASTLLETLCAALVPQKNEAEKVEATSTLTVPQPIVRQGTFDLELKEQEGEQNEVDITAAAANADAPNACMTQSTSSTKSTQSEPRFDEIPETMIASSATYDGDRSAENEGLQLPEVATSTSCSPIAATVPQTDVNDIIEQLSKLLEQHHLTQQQTCDSNTATNPTFIVVMNANQLPGTAQNRNSFITSQLDCSINDGSPELNKSSASTMRRRSQSLSIHDKLKIVQLTVPPTNAQEPSTSPVIEPAVNAEVKEFKTPLRPMQRRNSFSNGTPYTSTLLRRTNAHNDTMTKPMQRRSAVLETHHESQQQQHAIVRPMPHANLNAFKPDLKKKVIKTTESIVRSNGPLKATIPVKKVAPMLKTSPPTPEAPNRRKSLLHTTMQTTTKSKRMSYIHNSTPVPLSRSAGQSGYPNACSTPGLHTTSPTILRGSGSGIGGNRLRYSHIATTPIAKQSLAPAAAAAGLKRRTLTEFKAKSPLKPRMSFGGASSGSSVANKSRAIAKTPSKLTTARPATRLTARASISGSAVTYKNKENKHP